jgi:hypothetical protein
MEIKVSKRGMAHLNTKLRPLSIEYEIQYNIAYGLASSPLATSRRELLPHVSSPSRAFSLHRDDISP